MTCHAPPPLWWQDYQLGRFTTPQQLYSAAWGETPDPAQLSDRFFMTPDPGPTWDAPERLKAPLHFKGDGYQRQARRADWTGCDPRLIVWSAMFQDMARKREIPLYVHCALRSAAEQAKVNAAGNSKAIYPRSAHNNGEAVDIVHGVFHWNMNKAEWLLLHTLGQLALTRVNTYLKSANKLKLTWGGNFRSLYDPAHWEITDYRTRIKPRPEPLTPLTLTPRQILCDRENLLYGL